MDSALYASMHVLVDDECSKPRVCENASISVNSHNCDDMLHESLGVIDIPNIKLLKKKVKKFHKNLSELFCEKDNLIAKLNESNKLVDNMVTFCVICVGKYGNICNLYKYRRLI